LFGKAFSRLGYRPVCAVDFRYESQ